MTLAILLKCKNIAINVQKTNTTEAVSKTLSQLNVHVAYMQVQNTCTTQYAIFTNTIAHLHPLSIMTLSCTYGFVFFFFFFPLSSSESLSELLDSELLLSLLLDSLQKMGPDISADPISKMSVILIF